MCVCAWFLFFCSACLPPPPSCLQPFTHHLPDLPTHNWLTTLYTTLNTVHCTQFFHTFNDFKSTQTTTQLFFTDMRHNVHPHTTCSQLSHTRQRDVTIPNWVLALLWYPSLCLLSKEVTLRDPFKTHGPGRVWTCRGGGPSCEWFTSARNLWCDRSLPLPKDCPQYIPKGKPTPASKLAFVTSCGCSCKIVSKGSCSSCSCSCSCLRDVIVVVVL